MAKPYDAGIDQGIPYFNIAKSRRTAIIQNLRGIFRIEDNPKASGKEPWYEWHAQSDVQKYSPKIESTARKYGLDPDFLKSIMYMETTHGFYDKIYPFKKTILPMNIHADYWKDLGYSKDDLKKPKINIRVGAHLLKEIWDRTENPTISKVATLYNNLSADRVSNYGARVEAIHKLKPWTWKSKGLDASVNIGLSPSDARPLAGGIFPSSSGTPRMTSPTIRPKPVTQTKVSITPHEIAVVRPYKVKPGDRIWNLADEFGYRNRRLFTDHVLRANTKLDPSRLRIGQKIWLPFKKQIGSGVKNNVSVKPILSDRQASPNLKTVYNFQRGDTVWRKAPEYGYTNPRQFVYDFKKLNPGVDPNRVYAGRTYNMPFGGKLGAQAGRSTSIKPSALDVGSSLNLKSRYTFQRGDTVWRKAPDYGYSNRRNFVNDFKKFNPGIDPNRVYAGKTYNMPFKGFAGARTGITSSLRPKPTVPQPGSLQWMTKGLR